MAHQVNKPKSRIEWIDSVRGLLIILMVAGHNIQYASGEYMLADELYFHDGFFKFIYSFHMPCLMIISGYFFGFTINKENFWRNRIKTILVPTLMWSLIPVGVLFISAGIQGTMDIGVVINGINYLLAYYWFLWAILICSLLIWTIHKFCEDSIWAFALLTIPLLFVPDWLNAKMWVYMYPFFTAGYLWNSRQINVKCFVRYKMWISCLLIAIYALLFAGFGVECYVYTTGTAIRNVRQLVIDLYRYAIGFVGSGMVIWIGYCLYPIVEKIHIVNRILVYCGRVSLTVYFVSSLLNKYVLPVLTAEMTLNYAVVLVETVLVAGFCVGIDWLIKRSACARKLLLGSR